MKNNYIPCQSIYDIIIEKVRRKTMIKNNITYKWEIPQYSKSEINKAGKIITTFDTPLEERKHALEVLNNWRAAHAYPLQVIASNLRQGNPNAVVVQRLKRLESITGKIERFPDMNLYRMQDLGGCRVIVNDVDQVYNSLNRYKKSRIRHILKKENDYIQNPKPSGYRSYHMVYQFQSDKKDTYNKNILIEIQFRTRLQHTWATAVEMMGLYTKNNLKSSQGDNDILKFFTLVSSVFALRENTPLCPNTPFDYSTLAFEIKEIDKRCNIISKLEALKNAFRTIQSSVYAYKNAYYLLILDYTDSFVQIKPFKHSDIEIATRAYNEIEQNISSNKDAVLVSAKSYDALRIAYPNYFIDISEFIYLINNIIGNSIIGSPY